MAVLFFALWMILNGRITLEIVLFGIVISGLLYWFCVKFLDYSPRREWQAIRLIPSGLKYAWTLLCEIVKSNLAMLPLIYSRRKPEPKLVTFKTPLKRKSTRCILANSITVTPGTISVYLEEDTLTVHCLDTAMADGIEDLEFQRQLLKMEQMLEEGTKK